MSQAGSIELHGLSDASKIGCACVIYFRFDHLDESVTVRQITSNTREVRLSQFISFGNVCCSSTSATSGLLHLYNLLS